MSENKKLYVGRSENRFDYIKYNEKYISIYEQFKIQVKAIEASINMLGNSRYTALALTDLENVYMWIGKAIRDSQIEEERNDC